MAIQTVEVNALDPGGACSQGTWALWIRWKRGLLLGTALYFLKMVLAMLLTSGTLQPMQPREESRQREVRILLDLQVAVFLEDGREANLVQVSTGRPGHGTPAGDYYVRYRRRAPMSSTYMVRMPWWICFDELGELGMHQSTAHAEAHLGEPVSHGCIRLGRFTAGWAYDWLPVGARVNIH